MTLQAPVVHHLVPAVSGRNILHSMGIDAARPVKPRLARLVKEVLEITKDIARPAMVWRIGNVRAVSAAFPESRRLQRYLRPAESAAIVAATAGSTMEARILEEPDSMKAYMLGAAATSVARNTLVQTRRLLTHEHPGQQVADSLSPGTDGLPFKLQIPLFELLPTKSIGISLDADTLLMTPLASVTAIIAWGYEIDERAPLEACEESVPHCETCPSRGCQLRIKPFETQRASA